MRVVVGDNTKKSKKDAAGPLRAPAKRETHPRAPRQRRPMEQRLGTSHQTRATFSSALFSVPDTEGTLCASLSRTADVAVQARNFPCLRPITPSSPDAAAFPSWPVVEMEICPSSLSQIVRRWTLVLFLSPFLKAVTLSLLEEYYSQNYSGDSAGESHTNLQSRALPPHSLRVRNAGFADIGLASSSHHPIPSLRILSTNLSRHIQQIKSPSCPRMWHLGKLHVRM